VDRISVDDVLWVGMLMCETRQLLSIAKRLEGRERGTGRGGEMAVG
jgi:hypothetical protein